MSIKLNQVGVMLCNADDLRNVQEPLFVECFTGADLWVECMGPDHCPVWADLDMLIPQLPQDFLPPALQHQAYFCRYVTTVMLAYTCKRTVPLHDGKGAALGVTWLVLHMRLVL